MSSASFRCALVALVVGGLLSASPSAFAAGTAAPNHAWPNHKVSRGSSTNWSGYALGGPGPYTSVSASWTQPAVDCATTRSGWSAFWVGLDGDTTETVEQTGTEADCSSGKPIYGAWYEMYPRSSVSLHEPVSAGDSFTASVTYAGKAFFGLTSKFVLSLSDTTQGWSRTETKFLRTAKLGSAEAIAEAPSSLLGVLPLSDFGAVAFSGVSVNGSLLSASTPGIEPITMVSEEGAVEAEPSAIAGGSFSDTWYSQ
jgi:hypothetical protein